MIALNEDECWTSGVRHGRALLLAACPAPSLSSIEKSSHVFSTLDFTLGVSYFRVRRQLDLSHVDPRVGPDRTVAAREAGNLVVVPTRSGRRRGGVVPVDPPPWHRGQFVWKMEPPLRAGQNTASVGWVRLGGGYPRVVGLV